MMLIVWPAAHRNTTAESSTKSAHEATSTLRKSSRAWAPPHLGLADYAGLSVHGDRIAVVSQESSKLWVGRLDEATLKSLAASLNVPITRLFSESEDGNSVFGTDDIKQMLAQGDGGFIVHISSAIGKRAFANLAAYGATKRALESLIETAAQEYSSQGIIINGIAPGSVESATFQGFTNGGDPAVVQYLADTFHLVKRIGRPEVVANMILALCAGNPREAFVTGATIPVDGGWIFRQ